MAAQHAPPHSAKILTIGPPAGRIADLVSKVTAIQNKHGPFAALFILGDLFSSSSPLSQPELDLIHGSIHLPIPTYFHLGSHPLPQEVRAKIAHLDASPATAGTSGATNDNGEAAADVEPRKVTNNLFYLGKSGVCVTPQGLRVAFCGGRWDAAKWAQSFGGDDNTAEPHRDDSGSDLDSPYITTHTLQRLLSHPSFALPKSAPPSASAVASSSSSSRGREPQTLAAAKAQAKADAVIAAAASDNAALLESRPPLDLLLTAYWPSGVTLFSSAALPDPTARIWGCAPLANMARAGAPRYHFCLAPGPDDATPIAGLEDEVRQTGVFWEREPYLNDLAAAFGIGAPSAAGQDQGWATRRRNASGGVGQVVTRFISLARFANAKKARWFMALNLVPASVSDAVPSPPKPVNTTASPYFVSQQQPGGGATKRGTAGAGAGAGGENGGEVLEAGPNFRFAEGGGRKRPRTEDGVPPRGYRCRICGSEAHYIQACPQKGSNRTDRPGARPVASSDGAADASAGTAPPTTGGPPQVATPMGLPRKPAFAMPTKLLPVGPEDCWFCLSNPQCVKHLIVSVGEETYVALPRGALPSPVVGGHLLVLPLAHFGSLLEVDGETARETWSEMRHTLDKIRERFERQGVKTVAWMVGKSNRVGTKVGHTVAQVVAVEREVDVLGGFERELERRRIEVRKGGEAEGLVRRWERCEGEGEDGGEGGGEGEGTDYMVLWLEDQMWTVESKAGARWSVLVARQTLATLLNVPDAADWKNCTKSEQEEREDVGKVRELLKE
ncbi:hypothetical protein ACQY0O_004585 [Thecaphora frezii]